MLNRLVESVRRSQFRPGLLSILINPYHFARTGLFRSIMSVSSSIRGKVLDVGCGRKPYAALFPATEYIGLELDTPYHRRENIADHFYDGTVFPFADAEFDAVVANQVLEHVFTPDRFLREIHRVLKPGGALLLTAPFVWDEHEQPHDFARYSSFGLRYLLEQQGFVLEVQQKSLADVRVVFQIANTYLYKKIMTPLPAVNALLVLLLLMPLNVIGELAAIVFPRNNDLYLDNIVLARKALHA